jgi:uncharacterized protein
MLRLGSLLLLPLLAAAQSTPANIIQASGTASIAVNPDQAQLTVSVLTQAATAQEAAQSNATLTTTVLAALNQVVGTTGTIQTVGYSVTPRYDYGAPPKIAGYQATNTLQVTTTDLSLPGRIIDTANANGANAVSGLTFGLQDPDPVTRQALTQAAKIAIGHASAIAAGLGVKTGAVTSAQEGSSVSPYVVNGVAALVGTPTPVQTGTVSVSATVTVAVQMVQ